MQLARQGSQDPMETVWILLALLCRLSLIGIGMVGLAIDAIRSRAFLASLAVYALLVILDSATVVTPFLRWRIAPLLAGVLAMLAHYAVPRAHHPAIWDPWYLAIAVIFLVLPGSSRDSGPRAA